VVIWSTLGFAGTTLCPAWVVEIEKIAAIVIIGMVLLCKIECLSIIFLDDLKISGNIFLAVNE